MQLFSFPCNKRHNKAFTKESSLLWRYLVTDIFLGVYTANRPQIFFLSCTAKHRPAVLPVIIILVLCNYFVFFLISSLRFRRHLLIQNRNLEHKCDFRDTNRSQGCISAPKILFFFMSAKSASASQLHFFNWLKWGHFCALLVRPSYYISDHQWGRRPCQSWACSSYLKAFGTISNLQKRKNKKRWPV